MKNQLFILVPSNEASGPVKGAQALANALCNYRDVTLVYLKNSKELEETLDRKVRVISLSDSPYGWFGKLQEYRSLLEKSGEQNNTISISMCFSADLLNKFCSDLSTICSSVRGNLPQNYKMDYGVWGSILAQIHLQSLRSFNFVFAMTSAMADQIEKNTGIQAIIVGNFIDEEKIEGFRYNENPKSDKIKFVFVGSFTKRKKPDLVIKALNYLIENDFKVYLDMVGEGPLLGNIKETIEQLGLSKHVTIHGKLSNPFKILASADALVLPSKSEGLSRAALEALYLGTPCVLRDVDGNAELLSNKNSGVLFLNDSELPVSMLSASKLRQSKSKRKVLLPNKCRQKHASQQLLEIVEGKS